MSRPLAAGPLPGAAAAVDATARRQQLVERSRLLRDSLAADVSALRGSAESLDARVASVASTLAKPLVIAAVVALVVVRPRRMFRLVGRAAVLWPVVRPFALPALRSALPLVLERFGARRADEPASAGAGRRGVRSSGRRRPG